MNIDDLLNQLDSGPDPSELVVDRKTGLVRQAGATLPEGKFVKDFKPKAERSLFVFARGVLGRRYLTPAFHKPICEWLQKRPPQRKMLLLPREHGKTSIVGHALPIHILIQPRESNIYFPGELGTDQRIYLVGETEQRATDSMRVIQGAFESNTILRGLWPDHCWTGNPKREAKKWNDREMNIPRPQEWPDPSIRAVGVGGAITGAHPSTLIKDDLTTLAAANSPQEMQTAIQWHVASRALINRDSCLEFIIGTRWNTADLPQHVIDTDATVEVLTKAIVEDGLPVWPEEYTLEKIEGLRKHFGILFPLLFMNCATDPALTDFSPDDLRLFSIEGDEIVFAEDERDVLLAERQNAPGPRPDGLADQVNGMIEQHERGAWKDPVRGRRLNQDTWDQLRARGEYLRFRT